METLSIQQEDDLNIRRGVYFLADDRTIDLAIAFLNSFKKHNPFLAICLIPFSDKVHQLKQLQKEYQFLIYDNKEALARCDEMCRRFHGQISGHYRKLVAWEGMFEEFIYIDVDTVVLDDVNFAFEYLDEYDFITSHSDWPTLKKYVWKDSIDSQSSLTPQQISYSTSSGFITSRKGNLDLNGIEKKLSEALALALAQHMQLFYKDQPFVNYLIITSHKTYTSLTVLYYKKGYSQHAKLELWAGEKGLRVKEGKILSRDGYPPIFLVHWAGRWTPRYFDRAIFSLLKLMGLRKEGSQPVLRFFIPYKKLWEHYRYNKV